MNLEVVAQPVRNGVPPPSAATDVKTPHGVQTRLVEEADRDGVTLVFPGKVLHGKPVTLETTFLFNRTGAVGGEVCFEARDASGKTCDTKRQPLAETVMPQKGVLLK